MDTGLDHRIPVVFFGSGPVALDSLAGLAPSFSIEAIITKPATAEEMKGVQHDKSPVYAVSNKRELDELFDQVSFQAPLAILVDFGVIVSQKIIGAFPKGIVNSHFSLLPQWRGADPITFAILSGQPVTGVSLMILTSGMDEGPVLEQITYDIPTSATAPELTEALVGISNQALRTTIPAYARGEIKPLPQAESNPLGITVPTYSRKIAKEDGIIDWHKPASIIEREIRAFISWPKSHTVLAGREVVITEAHLSENTGTPGKILIDKNRLFIYCGEKSLEICRLKPAGKQEMPTSAFLAGYRQFLQTDR